MEGNNSSGFIELCKRTRIRKPPGGDTNDIFYLENRQRIQKEKLNVYEDMKNEIKGENSFRPII